MAKVTFTHFKGGRPQVMEERHATILQRLGRGSYVRSDISPQSDLHAPELTAGKRKGGARKRAAQPAPTPAPTLAPKLAPKLLAQDVDGEDGSSAAD